MKDKLSLEELKEWLRVLGSYCRAKTVYHGKTQRITTFKQAYEQIKALLQPVPEDKLNEFVKNCLSELRELIENGWEWNDNAVESRFKKRLKEYEEMKEEI